MPLLHGLDRALRWLRLQRRRKQREVAQAAGITQAMLCSYEQGKRIPSLRSLEKILDTLEVELPQLHEVLVLVNEETAPPAPGRDEEELASAEAGRYPVAADRPPPPSYEVADPAIDLYRFLGRQRPLPPPTEEAFLQMLAGFRHWLRILEAATPDAPPGPRGDT